MARALINLPKQVKKGEIVEIRTLAQHVMETGYRHDVTGLAIPRDIINRFTCAYRGTIVFEAELFPAIAANPFLSFTLVAEESGDLVFTWIDDAGARFTETARLVVLPG